MSGRAPNARELVLAEAVAGCVAAVRAHLDLLTEDEIDEALARVDALKAQSEAHNLPGVFTGAADLVRFARQIAQAQGDPRWPTLREVEDEMVYLRDEWAWRRVRRGAR